MLETVHKPLLGYFRGSVDIVASLAALQGFKGDIAKVPEADIQPSWSAASSTTPTRRASSARWRAG